MKQFYLKTMILLMCLIGGRTMAYDYKNEGIFYNLNKEEKTAEVTYCSDEKYLGDITIPSEILICEDPISDLLNGTDTKYKYKVTSIGDNAFEDCYEITSIIIPAKIKIGNYAFKGCSGLTSINLNSATFIGDYAFEGCYRLTGLLEIPSNTKDIGDYAFANCGGLTKLIICDGVRHIGEGAFKDCYDMTILLIPTSVYYIGYNAFQNCKNIERINIGSDNIYIGKNAFDVIGRIIDININCRKVGQWFKKEDEDLSYEINTLTFGEEVESIENKAFKNCDIGLINIGTNIKEIGSNAFSYNHYVEGERYVNIKDIQAWCGVDCYFSDLLYPKYIPGYGSWSRRLCIYGEKVEHLIIPDGVQTIKDFTFPCYGIKSISIPSSVKSIGVCAFAIDEYHQKSDNVADGDYENLYISDLDAWCNVDLVGNVLTQKGKLYINGELVTTLKIPSSVTTIKNSSFANMTNIKSLIFPNGLKEIWEQAFKNCTGLESLILPNGLNSIGNKVFYGCNNIKTIVIPNTVTEIGKNAFSDCMNLYSVTSLINIPFNLNESAFQYTGTQYDRDIVYMAATLYVPRGRTTMYNNVQGWQKFMNIMETDTKFKLTYILDGEVYKTYDIQATEVITPEPDPYKEHFIFSGWTEIPYLMPAEDVTVTGSFTIDPEYLAGIEVIKAADAASETYYSPDGRRIDSKQRGLNIICRSDGTKRKVMVK